MFFLLLLLQALESSGQELIAVSVNLVDVVWGSNRPSPPCNPLLILPLKYSGEGVEGEGRGGRVKEGDEGRERKGKGREGCSYTILSNTHPLLLSPTGRSWEDKVSDVRKEMEKDGASVLVVTALDEVACKPSHLHTYPLPC